MEKIKKFFADYYTKDTTIDITLFKILGTAGILVSIISGTQSIVSGISPSGGLIDYLAAALSVLLLWYVDKTGKYVYGYILTSVLVFMGLFSMLFFEMGGMDGSMPYFFTFGIVFTFMMFKGPLLIVMETLTVFVYTCVCVIGFKFPDLVTPFETPEDRFIDQLAGILLSGVGIGLIFLVYIAQYRKQQKLAEEASLAKSRFLANMSHEIRTPINMMLGMNEMVIRESENEAIREYAVNAEDAGRQLLFVVNQILEYSKLEVGKDELINADYDLYKMLGGLKNFFEKEAAKKNIDFFLKMDEGIGPVLNGDMRKLSQILTNLLSNAVKYTREGSVTLTVKNLGCEGGVQTIGFDVTDTGIGIEKSELKRIFESFERSDLIKNRNIEGTGLGLAIAGNLAKMLGTEINVESEYGKGSCFSFILKAKTGDAEKLRQKEASRETFVAPDAVVLAVDDNPMNLSVIKSLLKKTMVKTVTAGSATECYEICKDGHFDAVFMDIMMPDTDGTTAMKHIKTFENLKNVPVIALTADVSGGTREKLLDAGFDAYLTKPVDWHELEECLMKFLPEDLMTVTGEAVGEKITEEENKYFAGLLEKYDISLPEGLHYMGGDILQFNRVAEYFIKNADAGLTKLREGMEKENYADLTLLCHSLKGNARNVGGIELHYQAKRMEKRLRDGDTDYVRTGMPMLEFEWKRVTDGLLKFSEEFKPVRERLEGSSDNEGEPAEDASFAGLLEAVDAGNRNLSLKIMDALLKKDLTENEKECLLKAKEKIQEIEFDEAYAMLKELGGKI